MKPPPVVVPADVRFPLERANGIQIVKTAAAIARTGTPTTLVVRSTDPRPAAEILALYGVASEVPLEVRRLRVLHRQGLFALPRALFLLRAGLECWARCRRGGVVYTRDLQLAELALRLGVRPLVYEAHAIESVMYAERARLYGTQQTPSPRKAARLAGRERLVWTRADGVVTTTSGIRDGFADSYGERRRTLVVPNGCDIAGLGRFPGLAQDQPPRVVYAGQLYPWKGVDVLVEAMAETPSAQLVILGGFETEPDLERVRRLVQTTGLADRTSMLGTVPQARVAAELARAAVVVVPFLRSAMSERHTSPIKAFEAMGAGRPIVASDLPSTREVLSDGRDALLVPPGDAQSLASAVRRLLEDRELATRLAQAAFEKAPRYTWDARARRLVELFEEVA